MVSKLTSPAAVAVASAGTEEGILVGQGGGLDPVDGVCICVFTRDGTAALAVADKRALQLSAHAPRGGQEQEATDRDFWLVLVAELLEVGILLVGGHEGLVGHGLGRGVVEVARVWVLLVAGGG